MYFSENNFKAVEVIQRAAEKHGLSMVEVALRWIIHHSALIPANKGGNDGVIIGLSKIEQMDQNIESIRDGLLLGAVVEALDVAWTIAKPTSLNPWLGELEYTYNAQRML